ncbi:transketolase family protein [Alicyclobacillus kakegawensis]|uniref:transketolase family protein n=1 Tax=Alicyclobacillus kakegawensis TaxID=392012 RepID=UPI000833191C|nr:transketolase C-terminal domain-containing protein [Alicyclobacillus kakegawensis]
MKESTQMTTQRMANVFTEHEAAVPSSQRTAVIQELIGLASRDTRVVVTSADMGAAVAEFRRHFPNRYFDFGIAEANAISAAAGMAACDLIPYVISMAPFGAIKCAEQIRTDVAYNHLPVRILAFLSGLAMGFFGASHHAIEDIAILRTIPNLTLIAPSDPNSAIALLRASAEHPGPVFFRLSEGVDDLVYPKPPEVSWGKILNIRRGVDVTIVATGIGVRKSLEAANVLEQQGISVCVMDAVFLKPFDHTTVAQAARTARAIITVDEHSVNGGLATVVAETLARHGISVPLASVGLPDEDLEVGVPSYLLERYGVSVDGIVAKVNEVLR